MTPRTHQGHRRHQGISENPAPHPSAPGTAALFTAGNRLLAAGQLPQAESCFRQAIRLAPQLAEVRVNLALLLEQDGRTDEAEQQYLHALALNPRLMEPHLNLGVLLTTQKRLDEAEAALRRALALAPTSPAAWTNLGVIQACRKQEDEAEASYRQAIALTPSHRLAWFNLSYLLLRQGRFAEGWQCLEQRDWYARLQQLLPCPRWQGESLAGRSLLIGFEAGHGDMIQFCRYAAVMKSLGAATVSVLCHPALKRLFTSLAGADAVYGFDEAIPAEGWDYWTPPLSMPYHCRTRLETIPADIPYVQAEPQAAARWATELAGHGAATDLRVGLVWRGNPRFENDADRSLPGLTLLEPLGTLAGLCWFSLQKGAGEDEAAHPPPGLPLVHLGPRITDFADAAAIVANLDLIITVDTAMAHLAGALGKPCWVLLPDYKPDWRWLADRNDSPWYPGVMRLFRQPSPGDWTTVLEDLTTSLRQALARPPPLPGHLANERGMCYK